MFHTVAWQYFRKAVQRECDVALKKTGAMATTSKPSVHLSMEANGKTLGATIRLRLWPEQIVIDLSRVDFHERWITFSADVWQIM